MELPLPPQPSRLITRDTRSGALALRISEAPLKPSFTPEAGFSASLGESDGVRGKQKAPKREQLCWRAS
ncbi:hypothetical protein OPV22_002647 [Ensete ventricosum]|uniref:Uncharacterized protein n=1 Tax=Ensete ventricosum TaxID=4639 RepID=A0AAV8RYM0_ENSVE|nr:hypothetical protein OPV22_002647 [Ensete ventricosum]